MTEEIVKLGSAHDFLFLLNHKYLDRSRSVLDMIERLGGYGNILLHDYPAVTFEQDERLAREQIANLMRNDRISTSSPDVYHISSLFEGESVFGAAASYMSLPGAPVICSGTLYDFIPDRYPDKYLTHWAVANWWKRTVATAARLDVGLAISDATKQDAERLLGLEPDRVVNISGSISEMFRELGAAEKFAGKVWKTINPEDRFILYVGGEDFRKNLHGTLEAFAIAHRSLGGAYKLAIVYKMQPAEADALRRKAADLGVGDDVILTGFVSDEELVELYNACSLFIFPSLYEGLGLPVIEAMRCGAPVIVGDNSSLIEIVPNPEFRFDASDPVHIAEVMHRVLTEAGTPDRMRAYSRARAAEFTWEKSARRALDAWEEAYARRKTAEPKKVERTTRIAMFTPLPPQKTGIAAYAADLIASVRKFVHLDLFVEDTSGLDALPPGVTVKHHSMFPFEADGYDAVVYQLGNSPFHHYMLPYVRDHPGVVVIHDAYLGHLSHDPGNPAPFARQVVRDHGGAARALLREAESLDVGARKLIQELTCSPTHVHRSVGVIVHSEYARRLLLDDCTLAIAPQISVLHQQRKAADRGPAARLAAREKLGIVPDEFVIGTFGHVAHTKGILELIEAFRTSNAAASRRTRFVLVGELEGGPTAATPFAQAVLKAIAGDPRITITGFVDDDTYDLHLSAIDVGVQLRTTTRGETSRAVLDLLAYGVPLVYNRLGWTGELPPDIADGLETFEPSAIREAIDALAADEALRARRSATAAAYVRETLDPDVIGATFVRTVLDMTSRARECGPARLSTDVARLLRTRPAPPELLSEISSAYVAQERSELEPRLLIDVTHIRENDLKTGVQRVVRELTRAAYAAPNAGLRAQAFAYSDQGLLSADDFAQSIGARDESEEAACVSGALTLRPFDKILMADGTWHLVRQMRQPIARVDALGGSAYGLVHDILPLQHPELFPDHVRDSVLSWLRLLLENGRGLICTSKTGADALIESIETLRLPTRDGLRIGYAKLGANFSGLVETKEISPSTKALLGRPNLFLMVGTIEPRKGHAYVLDAFEQLWSKGGDATLVFAGTPGWDVDALLKRIREHPEAGRRFFYLNFVPDADLKRLYESARATII
ncbi:MAG: glycosyltransferase, partial [Phyllobacteriaceae bacterium]|nr:glycosyltransferase [Phyllobacteriaceae bacterium]